MVPGSGEEMRGEGMRGRTVRTKSDSQAQKPPQWLIKLILKTIRIVCYRTEIDEDSARDPSPTINLSEVDVGTLHLLSIVALVNTISSNTVLGADSLPKER